MDIPPRILDGLLATEALLFASDVVCLGTFRCPPSVADFPGGNPCNGHTVVFPRRAVWIQHDGGRPFVADPSTVTLYNRGQVYHRSAIDPAGDDCEWMAFSSDVLADAHRAMGDPRQDTPDAPFDRELVPAKPSVYAAQRRFFTRLIAGRMRADASAVEETAMALLSSILGDRRVAPQSARVRDAIESAKHQINMEAIEGRAPASLRALARACELSPYTLCREFHRATGVTITDYRMRLRVFRSLEPLASERDLATLALASGFCSHSHYGAAFRKTFGATPSRVRQDLGLRV